MNETLQVMINAVLNKNQTERNLQAQLDQIKNLTVSVSLDTQSVKGLSSNISKQTSNFNKILSETGDTFQKSLTKGIKKYAPPRFLNAAA